MRWISEGLVYLGHRRQGSCAILQGAGQDREIEFHGVPANFRLIPGMTLTADVKVGTRSVFRYIMGGFVRGAGEAMREP